MNSGCTALVRVLAGWNPYLHVLTPEGLNIKELSESYGDKVVGQDGNSRQYKLTPRNSV